MERVPFFSPELDRSSPLNDVESIKSALALLDDPQLKEEIIQGNVTLAMIRPHVGPDANNLGLDDLSAAEQIENMINELGVLAKFSFHFTAQSAHEFYQGDPEASMSQEPARNPERYPNRWPEFIDFMSSGPTTVLLLHSPNGDAIPKWRSHLGHWNIDKVRDPSTIRGKLGVNKYNNLVHGSDAPESVLRELPIIQKCLLAELQDSEEK